MKSSLLIAILFFLHIPKQTPFRELTMADFKGHGEGAAYSVTNIDLIDKMDNGKYTFYVDCYFSPLESWINVKTPYVLAHENLHFKISYLYAEQMRSVLPQFQGCDSLTYLTVKAYYDHLIVEWRNEQQEYDASTQHGLDTAAQSRWNTLILNRLKQSK
jgi:hypothetical protein